jgi:hypothetical protein
MVDEIKLTQLWLKDINDKVNKNIDELKLLKYQLSIQERNLLSIIEDINKRLNILENERPLIIEQISIYEQKIKDLESKRKLEQVVYTYNDIEKQINDNNDNIIDKYINR